MTFEEYTFINEYNDNYNPVVAVKLADNERLINNNQVLTDCILNAWKKYNILFDITEKTTVKDIEFAVEQIKDYKPKDPDWIAGIHDYRLKNIRSVHKGNAYFYNYNVKY